MKKERTKEPLKNKKYIYYIYFIIIIALVVLFPLYKNSVKGDLRGKCYEYLTLEDVSTK